MPSNSIIPASDIKRIDSDLSYIRNSLDKKALKSTVDSEFAHQKDKLIELKNDIVLLEDRFNNLPPHKCLKVGAIDSNRTEISKNARDIKRLYIWLSGVGFSLLLLFLTLGVAALRLVDKMDFAVERNTQTLEKYEKKFEKQEEQTERIIRNTIIDTLDEVSQRIR